jgi:hypothetical protein
MAVIERRKTASAKYDPTSARAIREADGIGGCCEDRDDGSQDEYEDNDSVCKSKDEDTPGSCTFSSELETYEEVGVV